MQNEIRDKLVMLIDNADEECKHSTSCESCSGYGKGSLCRSYHIADHLIAGVIVPPCKIGDVVYIRSKSWHIEQDGISSYQITNLTITQNKKGVWTKKYRAMYLLNGKTIDDQINFSFDDIGKTVFLTREEAEQKLKENENNGYYEKAGGVD